MQVKHEAATHLEWQLRVYAGRGQRARPAVQREFENARHQHPVLNPRRVSPFADQFTADGGKRKFKVGFIGEVLRSVLGPFGVTVPRAGWRAETSSVVPVSACQRNTSQLPGR